MADFSDDINRKPSDSRDVEVGVRVGDDAMLSQSEASVNRRKHAYKMEHHDKAGPFIKPVVFGALDGIVTAFAVVCAAAGLGQQQMTGTVVLTLGIANVIADGFSMGFGEFVSALAEIDYAKKERAREEWETENDLNGEKQEMIDIYVSKGLPEDKAREVIDILSTCPKLFVDIMMAEELHIVEDEGGSMEALRSGVVMFFSFILFGLVPLAAYIPRKNNYTAFGISCGLVVGTLLLLGVVKGHVTGTNPVRSGLLIALNGCIAAGLAYFAAWIVAVAFHMNSI